MVSDHLITERWRARVHMNELRRKAHRFDEVPALIAAAPLNIIFDLDGTLADCEHRRHLVRGRHRSQWDAFFKRCVDDTPIIPVIQVLRRLLDTSHIEIWSGRSEVVRAETEAWLAKHVVPGLPLRMRPDKDYSPDDELKQRWLLEYDRPIHMVFDDRKKVVDMWRRNGIICAQVAPGDF